MKAYKIMTEEGYRGAKDLDGNCIINKDNVLILNLRGGEARKLGVIDEKNKNLQVFRKRGRHLFKKYNAYGFCYQVIANATKFNSVMLQDEEGMYLIPNKVILEKGDFLYFKTQGYEKQIFLDLEEIKLWKYQSIF